MVALVHIDNKNKVVSEAAEPVHCGHSYDEGEQVVDDGVQESVSQCPSWHVLHGLKPVVDVQLRSHLYEPEHVNTTNQSV